MAIDSLAVRFDDLARRVADLEVELRNNRPAVLASRLADLTEDVTELKKAVNSLQSTILRSTITLCIALAATSATIWSVFR